jgi:ribosomal protein L40E
MKEKILSSLILTLLLCSVLAGLFQPPAWGSNIIFVACRGIDKSQKRWAPIEVTNSFATTDEKIYLFIDIENVKGPIRVTFKVFDPQGELFAQEHGDWEAGSWNWIQYYVQLEVAKMAPGEWKAEAYANDQLISTLTFTLHPPPPHLVIADKTIEPKEGEPIFPEDTATIKYTLKNDGGSTAKKVQMKASDLPKGLTLLEQTDAKDLPAGSSEEWIIKIRADQPGNYSFKVQLLVEDQKLTEGAITVLVSEKPFLEQYGLYVGIAIVIVIVLVAVLVLMKRRKQPARPAQPVTTAPPEVAPQASTEKFCVNCGAPLPADALFCGKCGSRQ